MNFMDDVKVKMRSTGTATGYYDEGLRKYMIGVYNYMATALGISGLVAYIVSAVPALLYTIHGTPLHWIFMILPIVIAVMMSSRIATMSVGAMHACFWSFAASMGASLSYIFMLYMRDSIAGVFLITASVFGATALYGYTTRRNLASMGGFMIMGVVGLLLASIVNIFMRSSALMFAVSAVSVVVFIGLTAYDMQRIKSIYHNYEKSGDTAVMQKVSIMGALTLYMDFINLFTALLHLFGQRK